MNGDKIETSTGRTKARTYAASVRFDWQNAFHVAGFDATPYASYESVVSSIDSYDETGGFAAAHFEKQTDHANIVRVGLGGVRQLSKKIRLLTRLEGSYRFERSQADTKATLIDFGLAVDVPGNTIQQWGGRVSVGLSYDMGPGTGTTTLNAATGGHDPDYWLSTGYRVVF